LGENLFYHEPKSQEELAQMAEQAKMAYIQSETAAVKLPYVVLGILILLIAALFSLPDYLISKMLRKKVEPGFPRVAS
jgi:fucose permease